MKRRQALQLMAAVPLAVPLAAAPFHAARADEGWHDIDVTGSSPALDFVMQATPEGVTQTQLNYRGFITMLYFGYTFCPDVCPLTMQNVTTALGKTGAAAKQIRFLFVTVDPKRDSIAVLKDYVTLFGPNFVGLRGSPDQLAYLAKRFRIAYSVEPSDDPAKYEVTHSSAIYVFDKQGNARLLVPSMASQTPDINGLAADLVRLVDEKPATGWMSWLRSMV
jgi:protein SCO1/2